jgi:hypothetical protein
MMMNKVVLPTVVVICLTCSAIPARAQAPYDATIVTPAVEVRSGPSTHFYITSRLNPGEHVQVVRPAADGWLCIVPPAGSFSWVPANAVDHRGRIAVVTAADAPIRVGSSERNLGEPKVEATRVVKGTLLVVIGQAQGLLPSNKLLPITPTQGEVRYIPTSAVEKAAVVKQTSPPPVNVSANFSQPRFTTTGSTGSPDALLAQAQQAEREGRDRDAEALYEQVKGQVIATNYPLAVECLNKIQFLRDRQRAADALANRQVQATPASNPSPYPPPYAPVSSQYCYQPDPCQPVQLGAPVVANASPVLAASTPPPPLASTAAPTQPPPTVPVARWYEPGVLKRVSFFVNNKKAYRFEPISGNMYMYVTPDDTINLEPYVNRTVQLYGEMSYHGTLRTYHLNVRQVSVPQERTGQ